MTKSLSRLFSEYYTPLIEGLDCMEFLGYCDNSDEITKLYENNIIVGNFLRKYTPALYQDEMMTHDIINYIIILDSDEGENDAEQ